METRWPGNPQGIWDTVDDDGSRLWVPSAESLPKWDSPRELLREYVIVPAWWQRAVLLFIALFVAAVALFSGGLGFDGNSTGPVRRVLAVVLMVLVVGSVLAAAWHFVYREIRWRRMRAESLAQASETLRDHGVPIWGLLVGKVRLGDRTSGPNGTPDDIQFMFDLRVPRETLRRQRAVVTAWVDAVAVADTNVPNELGAAFDGRFSVHCADVFGERLRGVWMWRKASVLPYEVLGLSYVDPRVAEEFTDDDAVFLRRTPRELRRLSRMANA
ncbi:hypothetical protein AHOG_17085 [Actinoalloteichus hoggarensis]|uniref:Uncharacterized protein n=2 Tax=Actinoalloteichus hoggarensis TaxID=1470176 RepID=A0A221W5Q2_9PSEU|nr:hypothetical protein AHOG_17085 [Actinoalloteichus hoggarensis]